jgi:hypothetical protein
MNYKFTVARAKEINADRSLVTEEADVMLKQFEKQGNRLHGRDMTHIYADSVIADKMFDLVADEFFRLDKLKLQQE